MANEIQNHDDMEFVVDIMTQIAEYAVKNQMEPDDTIKTVAENMIALLEIMTLNHWGEEDGNGDRNAE